MRTTEPVEIIARCLHDRTMGQICRLARSFVGLGVAMTEGGRLHQGEDGPRWKLDPPDPEEVARTKAQVPAPVLACPRRVRGVAAAGGHDPGRLGGRGHRGGRLSTTQRARTRCTLDM